VYKAVSLIFSLVVVLASSADGQLKRENFQRADKATLRLDPSDFAALPIEVRTALEHRGCRIPQPYGSHEEKKNVISGQFQSAAQTDWAVLCSHEGRSKILVFYGGRSAQVDEIAEEADLQYLQVISGDNEIGYSRRLTVATPKIIRQHLVHNTRSSLSIEHDGIEDVFLEKASVIWYSSGGKWVRFSGAD
jgi:hypothetical protein